MAQRITKNLPFRRVDRVEIDRMPGAVEFHRNSEQLVIGFTFACPCGCGALGGVSFVPEEMRAENADHDWDHNLQKPSVVPSVSLVTRFDDPHWYGDLKDGVWQSKET